MFSAAVVLFGLCTAMHTCTMTTAVVHCATVTHEWPASIIVSPSLLSAVDRRLLYVTNASQIFSARRRQSPSAALVVLLLLLGGVEMNPGPSAGGSIRLGLLNARSVVHKAAALHDMIRDNNLDIAVITETWIPADAPDAAKLDVAPPGYIVRHEARRTQRRGGGIAVICRETLKMSIAFNFSSDEFESLALNIATKSNSLTVVCVYRPPGTITAAVHDAFCDLFDQLLLTKKRYIICGDFNAPGSSGGRLDPQIDDLLSRYNLVQHVQQATHTAGNVLDLVISADDTDRALVTNTTVQQTNMSTDHYLVRCNLDLVADRPSTVAFSYRDVKKIDVAAFRAELTQSELFSSTDAMDADTYADSMNREFRWLMDKFAPLRRKMKRRGKNDCRWLSSEARAAKQFRRRLERRYKRTGKASDKVAYKAAVEAAHSSIMKSRADAISREVDKAKGDQRAIWRMSNRLLHSKPSTYYNDDDCNRLVTQFSQFFSDKLTRISDTIASTLTSTSSVVAQAVRSRRTLSFTGFTAVTAADVQRVILSIPAKSSPLDIVPTSLLKSCSDVFAVVIARLANLSFRDGRFPTCFKLAEVLPLLKKSGANQADPSNFRPISNLSTISKVLERLALGQLRPHLLSSPNFCSHQSGFRTGHSTETALLEMLNDVYTAGDDRRLTVAIGLDISAAFDTISHDVLIDRLHVDFGLSSTALNWIASYLTERKQYVKVGQHSSCLTTCSSGVPQGSVLGPLLFAAYVSPVGDLIESYGVRYQQYADDTQLYLSMRAEDAAQGLDTLSACSLAVRDWYLVNHLLLNADKSEVIVLGTVNQLRSAPDIDSVQVAGASLSTSTTLKSLGVVLDQRLTFHDHVTNVVKSCNYHTRAIRHIRHLLTQSAAQTLACSLVNSRLDYCNSLLLGAPAMSLNRLQRAQNIAARVVMDAHRRTDAKPLLRQLHWLPVRQRILFKMAVLTRKAHTTGTPTYLSQHLHQRTATYSTRSSSLPLLTVPNPSTVFARRAFNYTAPTTWNSLPADILTCDSESGFKRLLKTHLFNNCFNVA